MEDQLIQVKTAKLAKEKGFDEIVNKIYMINHTVECIFDNINGLKHSDGNNPFVSAPTQSLLQRWLREKKQVNVYCFQETVNGFSRTKHKWKTNLSKKGKLFNKFEDALEDGLLRALQELKY